jgi:outer membrane protein TolC
MKSLLATISLTILFFVPVFTQTGNILKLEDCYELAWSNHPLSEKSLIYDQLNQVELAQIEAQRLPTLQWNTQASLQSENVALPAELPIPPLDLPLYRVQTNLDAQYLLLDGGRSDARMALQNASLLSNKAEAEMAIESLKKQVNEIFLGIQLLQTRLDVLHSSKKAIEAQQARLSSAVENGLMLPGALKELEVETLKLSTAIAQTQSDISALMKSLEALIGFALPPNTILQLPEQLGVYTDTTSIQRAELAFFEAKKTQILAGSQLVEAKTKPKLGAFLQAGLGVPNPLNFFDNSLSPFAIGGLRFSWDITDWKQSDRDLQKLQLQAQLIDNQKAAFEYQLSLEDDRYYEAISSLAATIEKDKEIIQLHEQIVAQKAAQLRLGTITPSEYILQATALRQSELDLNRHELELQKIKIDFLTQKGLL